MPALITQSKPDTRLLTLTAVTDLSQYRTDLTDQGGYWDEVPSARTALGYPRTVECGFRYTGAETGTLLHKANQYKIEVTAGGNIVFSENGATIYTFTGLVFGTWFVQWATSEDSGNAVSEFIIRDSPGASWTLERVVHTLPGTSPGTGLAVMADVGGGNMWNGLVIDHVRISRRAHSRNEFREDWVAPSPDITETFGESKLQGLPIETIGDQGHFAGPAYVSGGHSTITHRRRLWSPVLNESMRELGWAWVQDKDLTWTSAAKGPAGYYWHVAHCWYRPLPPGVSWVHVRAFVHHTVQGGGPIAPIHWRMYSCNRVGNAAIVNNQQPPEPATCYYTALQTTNTDHDKVSLDGEWLDFGRLKVAEDAWGGSFFMIGARFADADDDQRGYILNVTGEPLPPQKQGLDFIDEESG